MSAAKQQEYKLYSDIKFWVIVLAAIPGESIIGAKVETSAITFQRYGQLMDP